MNIDRCFIGVCSVAADSGVSAFNVADAAFKRALLANSNHSVVMATNEKLSMRAHHRIADVADIEYLVVEHDVPAAELDSLQRMGRSVLQAQKPGQ
jgi:DeoR/GlpR family transcriptional regulator of sugar metabolism